MNDVIVIDGMTGKVKSRIPRKVWDESVNKMGRSMARHIEERELGRRIAALAAPRIEEEFLRERLKRLQRQGCSV